MCQAAVNGKARRRLYCESKSVLPSSGPLLQLHRSIIYGLETVVSVLVTNTRTRWSHNEQEIFNTARGIAECSVENFEFIVLPASAGICKQNTN